MSPPGGRRVAGLILVLGVSLGVVWGVDWSGMSLGFGLDRSARPAPPPEGGRAVYQRARSLRSIPVDAPLVIHRIAPGAPHGPVDLRHQPWDWVEVYNRSDRTVPLAGYSLSDSPDQVRRFRFPAIPLPPRSGIRVWLSGLNSMDSVWSLAPSDMTRARGWRPVRQDELVDRFAHVWLGYLAPERSPHHDPDAYRLHLPVAVDQSGRFGLWVHAAAHGGPTSRLRFEFGAHQIQVGLTNQDAWVYARLVCPDTADGYWDLEAGVHELGCTVVEGDSLVNQVVVLRRGEPFGQGLQDVHATFKLKQQGEFIGLFDHRGVAVDHVTTPALATGAMVSRDPEHRGTLRLESVQALDQPTLAPSRLVLSPPGGGVAPGTTVHITGHDPDMVVYYTLDGSLPTPAARRATHGLALTSNSVLRARGFDSGGRGGAMAEASYWLDSDYSVPILSAIVEPLQLEDPGRGMMLNPSIRGLPSERRCHLTLITAAGPAPATVGGMRIQGRSSRETETKRNFRFVFRERYGQATWPGTLFAGQASGSLQSVVAVGRNLIRRQLAHEMMDIAGVRSPRRQAVRLFVNGRPFGLYLLMEDVQDPFYLEREFGHLDLDVIKEKTFAPLKWGTRAAFDREVRPYFEDSQRPISYPELKALFDLDVLCRWQAVVQFAGIDDSGQGYYVRDHRAQEPLWSIINWDFDHAFTMDLDQGWPMVQGYRSRLLTAVKRSSQAFQRDHLLPSYQALANHIAPQARLSARARELMATYRSYLDEEFEAHRNQWCFRGEIPDRDLFLAERYASRWEQLLHFVDQRQDWLKGPWGQVLLGENVCRVQVDAGGWSSFLRIDGWPAREQYTGYYQMGSRFTLERVGRDLPAGSSLDVNGVFRPPTGLRTNLTEDLVIRIAGAGNPPNP